MEGRQGVPVLGGGWLDLIFKVFSSLTSLWFHVPWGDRDVDPRIIQGAGAENPGEGMRIQELEQR